MRPLSKSFDLDLLPDLNKPIKPPVGKDGKYGKSTSCLVCLVIVWKTTEGIRGAFWGIRGAAGGVRGAI